jgi:hypothetical protein
MEMNDELHLWPFLPLTEVVPVTMGDETELYKSIIIFQ